MRPAPPDTAERTADAKRIEHVRRSIAQFPPLTDDQKRRLAELFDGRPHKSPAAA